MICLIALGAVYFLIAIGIGIALSNPVFKPYV